MSDLSNANLLRVDTPGKPSTGGDVPYITGNVLSPPVRCVVDDPSFAQRQMIDQLQLQSTAVLFVFLEDMANAFSVLQDNCFLAIQQDGQTAQTMRIDKAVPRTFGGESHVMCFVRAA